MEFQALWRGKTCLFIAYIILLTSPRNIIAMVQEKELFNARGMRIKRAQQGMDLISRLRLTFTSLVLILVYLARSPNVIKLNFALSFRDWREHGV